MTLFSCHSLGHNYCLACVTLASVTLNPVWPLPVSLFVSNSACVWPLAYMAKHLYLLDHWICWGKGTKRKEDWFSPPPPHSYITHTPSLPSYLSSTLLFLRGHQRWRTRGKKWRGISIFSSPPLTLTCPSLLPVSPPTQPKHNSAGVKGGIYCRVVAAKDITDWYSWLDIYRGS